MKKIVLALISVLFISFSACSSSGDTKDKKETTQTASVSDSNVHVVYYHFTRRCMTCKAVEAEGKKAVEEYFADEMKSGKVSFASYDLDNEADVKAAAKYNPGGQGLFVYKGDQVINLTTEGFSNAVRKPEAFHQIVKETVDKLL